MASKKGILSWKGQRRTLFPKIILTSLGMLRGLFKKICTCWFENTHKGSQKDPSRSATPPFIKQPRSQSFVKGERQSVATVSAMRQTLTVLKRRKYVRASSVRKTQHDATCAAEPMGTKSITSVMTWNSPVRAERNESQETDHTPTVREIRSTPPLVYEGRQKSPKWCLTSHWILGYAYNLNFNSLTRKTSSVPPKSLKRTTAPCNGETELPRSLMAMHSWEGNAIEKGNPNNLTASSWSRYLGERLQLFSETSQIRIPRSIKFLSGSSHWNR